MEAAQQVASFIEGAYGIRPSSIERPPPVGVQNTQYRVFAADGASYMLRVSNRRRMEEVAFEAALLARLASAGLPTPDPIRTASGTLLASFEGRPSILYPYLPGESAVSLRGAALDELGTLIGRTHEALRDFRHPNAGVRTSWDLEEVRRLVAATRTDILRDDFPGAAAFLASLDAALRTFDFPDGLPEVATHQDWKPDNILVLDGKISGILDFDNTYVGDAIHDLSTALMEFGHADGAWDTERLRAIIRGYESVRPLAAIERAHLGSSLQYRILRQAWTWSYYVRHLPEVSSRNALDCMRRYREFPFDRATFYDALFPAG